MKLVAIPAFNDNYLWLWHDEHQAIVVDPGQAQPVLEALDALNLKLNAILVTHHHKDHIGGIEELQVATKALVFGPEHAQMPLPYKIVKQDDTLEVLGQIIKVLEVPGHTLSHLAYVTQVTPDLNAPILFCGDTLFSGGCGRLFEGSPLQMLNSLAKLKTLPDETLVCCAHEYTLSNLKFALHIEPNNQALVDYNTHCQMLRDHNRPTLPSSMGLEKQINPFLRSHLPQVQLAAKRFDDQANEELSCFAALREWKNTF